MKSLGGPLTGRKHNFLKSVLKAKHQLVQQMRRRNFLKLPFCLLNPLFFPPLFLILFHMSRRSDIVVRVPKNLHERGYLRRNRGGCAAKKAFQEVPYPQAGEEVVRSSPEVVYKRLLEACGRMPRKSN